MLNLSIVDKIIVRFDNILRLKSNVTHPQPMRTSPAASVKVAQPLTETERKQSIAMMRINHSGEICAQALYNGQAFTAKSPQQYRALKQAAAEETDHLYWCEQRLEDLNGRASFLNPIWYAGSFAIGTFAGMAGDKISLGFLAETEYQVTKHIERHLISMPLNDVKSRAILEQMRHDELKHATTAEQAGGVDLPKPVKIMMRITAKILTVTANKI